MEAKVAKRVSKRDVEKLVEIIESILCKINEDKKGCISLSLDAPLCVTLVLIAINALGLVNIPWLIIVVPILTAYILRFLFRVTLLGLAYKLIKDGGFTIEE